jgi:predicted nucleic acid-binding protein
LKLAFDTNVVLDVLLDRATFGESARDLWAAVEKGKVEAVLAGHAFTTVWYLVAQARGAAAARGVVALVARVFGVAPVDQPVVRRALELEFRDFEDSVCAARRGGGLRLDRDPEPEGLRLVAGDGRRPRHGTRARRRRRLGGSVGAGCGVRPAALKGQGSPLRPRRRGQSQSLSLSRASGPALSA